MSKVKEFIKKYFLIICLVIISLFKIHITNKLPLLAFPEQVYDDGLMVKLAKNIVQGKWLGVYDSNTLIKGAGFPIFLALLKSFNISYIFAMNIFYVLACMYFIYSIKDDIKSKIIKIIIFSIMLFNPIASAEYTFQRVYRNGIGVFQTVFIFSAIYIVWKNRYENIKTLLPHILIAAINVAFLWYSREDSIWIIPFLFASLILTTIFIIAKALSSRKFSKTAKNKFYTNIIVKSLIILMPIWILIFSTNAIRLINYKYYGIFIERESETYLNKVLAAFYSVKANEEYPRVDNTREKINRIYEVSETLSSIKPYLEDSLDIWSQYGSSQDKKEVENGWFSWALKHAMLTAGKYFNPIEVNDFYHKIYDEIELALENNQLEREPNIILSTFPPFRDEYKGKFINYCLGYVQYIYEFRDIQSTNMESPEFNGLDSTTLSDFEFITNNFITSRNVTNARICGWYSLNNSENFKLYLTNEKSEQISEIPRGESSDVIAVYSLNPNLQYRFDFVITDIESTKPYENLFIEVFNLNDELVEKIPLDSYQQYAVLEGEKSTYSLSIVSIEKNIDPIKTFSDSSVKILNAIKEIYAKTGKLLFIISLVSYFIILILTIIKSIKNKKLEKEFDILLILSAYILSAIVVIVGVAYTGLTSCYTLMYSYLAVVYPLFIMFVTLGIGYIFDKIICKVSNKSI